MNGAIGVLFLCANKVAPGCLNEMWTGRLKTGIAPKVACHVKLCLAPRSFTPLPLFSRGLDRSSALETRATITNSSTHSKMFSEETKDRINYAVGIGKVSGLVLR